MCGELGSLKNEEARECEDSASLATADSILELFEACENQVGGNRIDPHLVDKARNAYAELLSILQAIRNYTDYTDCDPDADSLK